MGKNTFGTLIAATVLMTSASAFAADFSVTVDASQRFASVTNNSGRDGALLLLKSPDNMNLPLFAKLAKGATANVSLRFTMPSGVSQGMAEFAGVQQVVTVDVR